MILRRVARYSGPWGHENYKRTWLTSRRGVWTGSTRFGSTSGSRTVKYSAQSVRFRREQKRHCSSRAERISDGDPCMVDLRCVHTSGSRELVKKKLVKKMASVKNCRYLRIFARSVPVHTQMDINKFYCTFSTFLTIPELYHAYHKSLQPSGATGSLRYSYYRYE